MFNSYTRKLRNHYMLFKDQDPSMDEEKNGKFLEGAVLKAGHLMEK